MEPPNLEACRKRGLEKLTKLRALASSKTTLLAQTHDYPDPDTIASALGLCWLLGELEGIEGTIGYGGIIGRAENRAMIKILNIRMKRTHAADFKKYDLVALLDTQPEVGNHAIPDDHTPDIVFDHHFERELEGQTPAFYDVGGGYGATSSKVTELIMASGLTPPTNVATALFYGVKTDTANLGRDAAPPDLAAYMYLFPLADNKMLSEIENPQVPVDYFRVFSKAITRAKIYGNIVVSDLGVIYAPELCAEVADRMLQIEGVNHALAVGWFEESLFLSLRTRSRNRNAGKKLHQIVCNDLKVGTAGGHGPMAGARIPVEGRSKRSRADLRRRIIAKVVQAFGQDHKHFQRILSPAAAASNRIETPEPKPVADDSERPSKQAKRREPRANGKQPKRRET